MKSDIPELDYSNKYIFCDIIEINLEVTDINKKLLTLYWIPKLNQNPTKARIIITAPKCLVKPMWKAVTAALKLMFNQIEHYKTK